MNWTEKQYQEFMNRTQPTKKKTSKYHNQKVIADGQKFDSQKEYRYYCQLVLLQKAGEIIEIKRQVPFLLQEGYRKNGKAIREIKYIADFVVTYKDGRQEIIDVKGVKTKEYLIKKKMFEFRYKELSIKEV